MDKSISIAEKKLIKADIEREARQAKKTAA